MKFIFGLLTLVLAISANAHIAKSDVLCDGLNKALRDSDNNFVNIRGKYDFDLGEYAANVTFGGTDACITESGDGVSSVKCTQRSQNEAQAQTVFQNYVSDIQRCFGASARGNA